MYVTLRGAPKDTADGSEGAQLRRKVPSAVLAFGIVSVLTDISSESVAAVLPLYITAALGMSPLAYRFFDGIYQGVSAPSASSDHGGPTRPTGRGEVVTSNTLYARTDGTQRGQIR